MATRRIVSAEKTLLDKDSDGNGESSRPKATTAETKAPEVPRTVIAKLLFFTFSMITAPLASYYLSINTIYNGNSTMAGATAAVVANCVLIAYVVVAIYEDDNAPTESKKAK